ncbi:YceI family protein [Phenylobacterium sp.]|uniref:YceI family protein n=1 Tax=Phenylobacterium sp. TaxID=1871053 RepID=UPI0037842143
MKIGFISAASAIVLLAACNKPAEQKAAAAPDAAAPAAATAPATPITAPAGVYKLDPNHASLVWSLSHLGLSNYTAKLTKIDATVNFDPANPTAIKVTARVDPRSVKTDYPANYRETHKGTKYASFDEAIGADFLKAAEFPSIDFVSTKVEQTGDRTAKVTGDLTMLGVTKPITLDVTLNGALAKHPMMPVGAIGFTATGALNRSDFGMAAGPVGDAVKFTFNGEFLQQVEGSAPAQ